MPGIAGIYDPEFHTDLEKARGILRKSAQIDEDHRQVEIFIQHERIFIVSSGRGEIPATAFSTEEYPCILYGKLVHDSEIKDYLTEIECYQFSYKGSGKVYKLEYK